jgi:O-antigen/teichoic acid export membrane protein
MTILNRTLDRARLPLYRNALVLMVNSGITAGLGFVFWALTARLYPPTDVGLASAAISSALFVSALAQLGLPYALVRFSTSTIGGLPALTTTVAVVVAGVSAIAGAIFIAGIHTWAPSVQELAPLPALAAAVIVLAGATGASTVLVYASIGARDTRPALAAGIVHGLVKSVLVLVFAQLLFREGFSVVLAWTFGTVAAVAIQAFLLRRQMAPRVNLQLLRLGTFLRYSAGNWAGDLSWTAPGLLFPVLVVAMLGAEANAYFFIAWSIASLLAGIPTAVSSSLLAEGTHDDARTALHLRRAFAFTLPLVGTAIAICFVAAPILLGLFGAPYAASGVDTLRLLSLAAFPLSVNMLYLAVARVDRDIRRIVTLTAAIGGSALVLGVVLVPALGATGIALGYLVTHALVAIGLTADWLLRGRAPFARGRRDRSGLP